MKRSLVAAVAVGCSLVAACTTHTTSATPTPSATPASATPSTATPTVATPTAAPSATKTVPTATASMSSSATPSPTPTTPADPFANATLTPEGFGPIKVGMTKQQVIDGGWGAPYQAGGSTVMCPGAKPTDALGQRGIIFVNTDTGVLQGIGTRTPGVTTASGAAVGMTVAQLKAMYGSQLSQTEAGFQAPEQVYVVKGSGKTSLMFFLDYQTMNTVTSIYALNQQSGGINHGTDNC